MSYDPRMADGPYPSPERTRDGNGGRGGGGGGSVRAARERLLAAQRGLQAIPSERPRIVGLPQRPNQLVSQFSTQNNRSSPQQMPAPPSSSDGMQAISPTPQWPLPNDTTNMAPTPQQRRPMPAPQRPPQPVFAPPMPNESPNLELPLQRPSPRNASRPSEGDFREDDYLSPVSEGTSSSRPLTTSSAASEASSLGEIPDFPVPMPVAQPVPRRLPSLGPPPSARRGPSSYYSQMSYVSPIVEESENGRSNHGSYASSNVIPIGATEFYFDDEASNYDDERPMASPLGSEDGLTAKPAEREEQGGLVRQASLGRRTKPSLTTIRSSSSDTMRQLEEKAASNKKKKGPQIVIGTGATSSREDSRSPGPPSGSLSSGTALLDASSSDESVDSAMKRGLPLGNGKPNRSRSPLAPANSTSAQMPLGFEKEVEAPIHPLQMPTRQSSTLADRVGNRRPPRLNVDAVREAEARGSLTSLPDLIRRATRLAANLDRGKTASRLGLDFWESGAVDKEKGPVRRSGSITDMLASFPPPGDATPAAETPQRRLSRWPSALAQSQLASQSEDDQKSRRRGRRCCGMPLWSFIVLLIVLLALVAAAVLIPVFLIVIPKMKHNNSSTAAPTATTQAGQCASSITCENGGVAVVGADSTCNCLCTNGFTGKTCTTQADAACTAMKVEGLADNATIGSAIPRLLNDAQKNFSIPLDAPELMSLFSASNLSCTSENALVTFNGLASRSLDGALSAAEQVIYVTPTVQFQPTITAPPESMELEKRQAIGASNGIIFQASSTATGSAASSPTSTPTLPVSSNATALDFARIGVLFIFQVSRQLNTAVNAQDALQNFLSSNKNSNADNVNLGNGFMIDLVDLAVKLANGTVVSSGGATALNSTTTS